MGQEQNSLTVVSRVKPEEIDALNKILAEIASNLDANPYVCFSEITSIHFAAWVTIMDDPDYQPALVFELNFDGATEDLLTDLVEQAAAGMDAVYGKCVGYPAGGSSSAEEVKQYLRDHAIASTAFYVGCPGQTVTSIRNAIAIREEIEKFIDTEATNGSLDGVPATELHKRIKQRLSQASVKPVVSPRTLEQKKALAHRNLILLALVGIPLALLLLPLLLIWFLVLRLHEIRDNKAPAPKQRPIDPRVLKQNANNLNHLTTLVEVRPGKFRLYTLKGVLWLVALLARKVYINGQLGGIPTIHFARWLFMDGNRRLLFFSNYDGSWTSYLGDFVDRAAFGLTGIWGNTIDFPATNYLVFGGARHIDAFEQWSHEHNLVAQVWYSAYPNETLWNLEKDLELRDTVGQTLNKEQAEQLLRLL